MEWYPARNGRPDPDCPAFVDLDLFESDQVQEAWAIEGNVGPEVMWWLDGKFQSWWPKLTMGRARFTASTIAIGNWGNSMNAHLARSVLENEHGNG